MNLISIITYLYNRKLAEAIKTSELNQYLPLEDIHNIQKIKFQKLINHAITNVPYYRKTLKNVNDISEINKIKFLTKDIIKDNFHELKALNLEGKRFIENSTSGSTGEKTMFYSDLYNMNLRASVIRGDKRAGLERTGKSLYLWGAERDINNNRTIYKKIKDHFIYKNKILSSYHLSNNDLENYIEVFNDYKPNLLVSYPSPLYHFAKYIETSDKKIHQVDGIVTSAETLFPFQRDRIESVFNAKIFNRYGSREFGHIASECNQHDGLHINSDRLILEVINQNGKPCQPGELGEIVITDLDNYVFPFIRYKIGDLGVLSNKKCSCGINFPLLERIEGRIFDIVKGPNGNIVAGTFWTLLRNKVKGFDKFQVLQNELNYIRISVERNILFDKKNQLFLVQLIKDKLGKEMKVELKIVDKITTTTSGKHRWIISKISPYAK